jgi:two-component system cell cycle sensor histidine kinase/response regulator CckA
MTQRGRFAHDMMNHLGVVVGYSNLLLEELPPEDPRRADIDEIRKAGEAAIALMNQWSAVVADDER